MEHSDEECTVLSKVLMGGKYEVAVRIPADDQVPDCDVAELLEAIAVALRQFADTMTEPTP